MENYPDVNDGRVQDRDAAKMLQFWARTIFFEKLELQLIPPQNLKIKRGD